MKKLVVKGKTKNLIILLAIIVVTIFVGYYLSQRTVEYQIQSKTLFDIVYPENNEVFMQFPFWTVTNKEYNFDKNEYTIGEEVKIYGSNVEQLNGEKLFVSTHDLSELVKTNNNFYAGIVNISDSVATGSRSVFSDEYIEEIAPKIKEAKKLLKPYINSGKVIQMNLSMNKAVEENKPLNKTIVVDRIEIGDFVFVFDYFTIKVEDYMKSNSKNMDEYGYINGAHVYGNYYFNPSVLYTEIDVETFSNITSIDVYNVRGNTNIDTFREDVKGRFTKENIAKGIEGAIPVELQFDITQYPENLRDFDIMVNSILIDITMEDGEEFSVFDMSFEGRDIEMILFRVYNEMIRGSN